MHSPDIVIVGGARTAMAEYVGTKGFGAFKGVGANDLGARAIEGALAKAGVAKERVQHVVMGNAMQTAGDALYGARHAALKAGLPVETPALTVNRICGSGIQSVVSAAQMMMLGEAQIAVAGGMENMSQAPHVVRGAREGFRLGADVKLEDMLMVALLDPFCGFYMAQTAENLARKMGISREEQDAYALRSHMAGARAVKEGLFAEEIVPVSVRAGRKEVVVDRDDHIKPDTTAEGLASLPAAFGKDGTVTAGNASGIVDGGAALVLATADEARGSGLEVQAVIRGWGIAGVPPDIMGIGPVPAIRKLLEKTGVALDAIDLFEINEAFSAQYLACEKDLGLRRERCNVNGGAVALGHPLGATGSRLVLTLVRELRRRGKRYGIASACIGGGQGIALLIENPKAS
jgi:acetyl-CoA acetyltransferase family protein